MSPAFVMGFYVSLACCGAAFYFAQPRHKGSVPGRGQVPEQSPQKEDS